MNIINKKRDGHIHTPYCPHGTTDSLSEYINNAIAKGLEEITFTEHFPLPGVFKDKDYLDECAMNEDVVLDYIKDIKKEKEKYKDIIKINIGFEVDYVEGYEEKIKESLDKYGVYIEDSLLSVHFLKYKNKYYAVDYIKDFKELVNDIGGLTKLYDLYFTTLLKSINSGLGRFKPKRIAHPTLVRIFNLKYPIEYKNIALLKDIAKSLKEKGYYIDVNTAGLRKENCKEQYPSKFFEVILDEYEIPCIYGSDSHSAKDIAYNFI